MNLEKNQIPAEGHTTSVEAYKQLEDSIETLCASFEMPENLVGLPILSPDTIQPVSSAIATWEMATISEGEEMADVTHMVKEILESNGIPDIVLENITASLINASREKHIRARVALEKKTLGTNDGADVIQNERERTTEKVMQDLRDQR